MLGAAESPTNHALELGDDGELLDNFLSPSVLAVPGMPGPGMWLPMERSPVPLGCCSPLWTPYQGLGCPLTRTGTPYKKKDILQGAYSLCKDEDITMTPYEDRDSIGPS